MSDKCKTESTANVLIFRNWLEFAAGAAQAAYRFPKRPPLRRPSTTRRTTRNNATGPHAISAGYEFSNTTEFAFIESAVDTLDTSGLGWTGRCRAERGDRYRSADGRRLRRPVVFGRPIRRENGTTRISIGDDFFRANPGRHCRRR